MTSARETRGKIKATAALSFLMVWAATLALSRPASAQPSDRNLVLAGLGMAVPTYALGVVVHEGSHALAGKAVGGNLVAISFLPGRDPSTKAFHFGRTRMRGLRSPGAKAVFFAAPKVSDLLLLGAYSTVLATNTWPENKYGQLAITVVATGFWVDFAKDVLAFREVNDVNRLFTLAGWKNEWQRLPARLLYAGVAAGLGYAVWKGYERVFTDGESDGESNGESPGPALLSIGGRF